VVDDTPIRRRSLPEEVADRLRDDILSGTFRPGMRLVVTSLEERYGVSHIPIREALRILESEALVSSRRGSGAVVAEVGLDELGDLYDMRRLVEGHVLREAVKLYDDDVISRASASLDALLAVQPAAHDGAFWPSHHDFHWTLMRPGLTPWRERVLTLLWQAAERYQRMYTLVFGDVETAHREHRDMLTLATARDADGLVDCWLQHLSEKEQRVANGFRAAHDLGRP
jgi:DNA-binding GntR family transcriptional regulator